MYYIDSLPNILELGNQNNNTTTFQIDMSSWISQYPDGTIYVIVERPDKFTYPSEVKRCADLCEGILDWRVSNIDTFVAGYGLVQFRLIQGNDIMLSESVRSIVYKSAEPCTPDKMPQWLEAMIEASQVILDGQVICSDALAPEYNPNAIYPTAGVYCTHQGYLWELIVPINVAEPFNAEHWKKVDFLTSTRDYSTLINKPSIDGYTLEGDMTSDELGLSKISALNAHVLNQSVHVNAIEKERWNQSITPDMLEGALGFYYKKTEIDTKLSEVNQTINSLSDDVVHDQDFNEVLGGINQQLANITRAISSMDVQKADKSSVTASINTINQSISIISGNITTLSNTKANKSELPTKTSDLANDSGFITETTNDLTNYYLKTETYTKQEVDNLVAPKANKSELPKKTSDLTNDSGFITNSTGSLTNYYTKTETYTKQETNQAIQTLSNDVVHNQDFGDAVDGLNQQISTLAETKASKSELPTKTSDLSNDSGFITSTVNNLTNYYLKAETYTKQEVSDFVNGLGFITASANNLANYYLKSETYTKQEVQDLISQVATIHFQIVAELPLVGESNIIYLVPQSGAQDVYTEWVYINGAWANIGSTSVDLSDYYTKEEVNALLANVVVDANYVHTDNNFTTAEKNKLANIQANAQENTIESISVNGVPQTIGANKNVDISVQGGDSTLSKTITSNVEVGGAPSGTTFAQGMTFTQFAEKILVKELAPTITFSATNSGNVAVGVSKNSVLTLNITDIGTSTPTSIKFYNGETLVSTQAYVDGVTSYTYTITGITSNSPTTITVKGVLEYNDSTSTSHSVEQTKSFKFVNQSYYGVVDTFDVTSGIVSGLTSTLLTSKAFTWNDIAITNARSCFAYPTSYGNLTSIKDANNFDYIDSYTKKSITINGVAYNCYVLTDTTTISGWKQIFA